MQNSPWERSRIERSARRISAGLAAVVAGLYAKAARADWGENWGEMLWGSGGRPPPAPVPTLDGWGLLLLATLLAGVALVVIAKRPRPRTTLVLLVALAVPLAAYATTISMPYLFVNGTTADATQVNANFDTLVTESNLQDFRITAVEGLTGPHTHPGGDITSQVGDADTVDGVHSVTLEESAEIDADIAIHAAIGSAHHSRYTDAEALLAAVGVDAGTLDGLDSTDLEESAEIDADVAAHAIAAAAHHARYTDAEALAAAAGVDAGTLDGLDSTDFAGASHTHAYGNVAIVAQSGGAYTDPKAAMDDLATWCGVPSAANPCLVRVMPGIYDLGNNALTMQPYVDMEGSGENTTVITSTHSSASFNEASATLVGAANAEVRFLSVENQGGAAVSIAIFNPTSSSLKITNVTATASGGTTNCYGMINNPASSPILTNVESTASGGNQSVGVDNNLGSSAILTNVYAEGAGGANWNYGVNNSTASPIMTNVTAIASGGSNSRGVTNISSSPIMTNVTATASGGATTNYGVHNLTSSPTMTNVTATGSGGTTNEGVYTASGSPILREVTSNGLKINSADEFRFDPPKTYTHYLAATEFEIADGSVGTWTPIHAPSAYGYGSSSANAELYSSIHLPDGADVTDMTCYYSDDAPTDELLGFDFFLYSAAIGDTTSNTLAVTFTDPANFDDTTVRSVTDNSVNGTGDPVANSGFFYTARVTFTRSLALEPVDLIRFHGCKISYEITSLGLP